MRVTRSGSLKALVLVAIAAEMMAVRAQVAPPRAFARQVQELSEPGGSFDTDNLISNERSYLHVVPALRQHGTGGAYIGVGPDQNFSYIAVTRPSVAYIIDVRRDNLLLQLLFKALFETSGSRAEYLGHLFGRRLPQPADQWRAAGLEKIMAALDVAPPRSEDVRGLDKQIEGQIAGFGVPLSPQDVATITRFHHAFIDAGLSLKFQTFGRAPQSYYPTYRDLLLETDRQGHRANFLISEDDYQFVRSLQQRDLIIPVVGNLAGPAALAAIGRAIQRRGETVSTFYVSNVELYLFQRGLFQAFARTVSELPRGPRSLLIRSVFNGPGFYSLPDTVPGYASASLTLPIDQFVRENAARKYETYDGLLAAHR